MKSLNRTVLLFTFALVGATHSSPASSQDLCQSGLLYESNSGSSEFCSFVDSGLERGELPVIFLPVADDDCPDDGDPTLECDPTLRLLPNREFAGFVSVGPGVLGAFELDPAFDDPISDFLSAAPNNDGGPITLGTEEMGSSLLELQQVLGQAYPWAMPGQRQDVGRALIIRRENLQ